MAYWHLNLSFKCPPQILYRIKITKLYVILSLPQLLLVLISFIPNLKNQILFCLPMLGERRHKRVKEKLNYSIVTTCHFPIATFIIDCCSFGAMTFCHRFLNDSGLTLSHSNVAAGVLRYYPLAQLCDISSSNLSSYGQSVFTSSLCC